MNEFKLLAKTKQRTKPDSAAFIINAKTSGVTSVQEVLQPGSGRVVFRLTNRCKRKGSRPPFNVGLTENVFIAELNLVKIFEQYVIKPKAVIKSETGVFDIFV